MKRPIRSASDIRAELVRVRSQRTIASDAWVALQRVNANVERAWNAIPSALATGGKLPPTWADANKVWRAECDKDPIIKAARRTLYEAERRLAVLGTALAFAEEREREARELAEWESDGGASCARAS